MNKIFCMAVHSLRYRPNAQPPEETKAGFIVYDGSAVEYHSWRYRTEVKIATASEDWKVRTCGQIIESLRGEALQVAMDMDQAVLLKEDGSGIAELVKAVSAFIFPLQEEEAKSLYREGHKVGGSLSRQHGESMTS